MAEFIIDPRPHWCVGCLDWCPGHDPEGFCQRGRKHAPPPAPPRPPTPPARPELVNCRTPGCHTRTLPRIAASEWAEHGGRCDICRMSREEREHLLREIRNAQAVFDDRDRRRESWKEAA